MRPEQAVKDDAGWSNFQGFEDRPTQPELVRLVFHAKASPGYPEPLLLCHPGQSVATSRDPRLQSGSRVAQEGSPGMTDVGRENTALHPTSCRRRLAPSQPVYSPHVEACLGPGLRRDDGGAWWKRRSPKSPFRGLSGRRRHSALTSSYGSQKPTAGRYREGTSK